ncbi:insulin-like growth factor-binding protein complex acid labile subunit [Pristis pectinata]|uniref:insulin-like growth factor-binding protein complex acid labile subunit n=1 Tax=Pristis pectinata TaxID=685728 RepID=UPI00223CC434|nr:insulin-like growth factor-binding protein complex acid labile subunit [Pristis pectinata]
MDKLIQLLLLLLPTGLLSACPEKCFCYSKVVDCRGVSLLNFPSNVDQGTETLFLDETSLIRIPQSAFENLKNLSYLGLSRNCLLLHNYTFDLLLELQALDLSANHLSELREDLFGNLPNLTWLALANNNFKTLPVMTYQEKLTYLDLSSNELMVLQGTFNNFPRLDTLLLNNNRLRTLSSTLFDPLLLLDVLDLSNNELSSLPLQLFKNHHKLTDLRLDHNRLKALTASLFTHQNNLQYLTISGNLIASFPHHIFANLTNLSMLDLSNNSLTCLPIDLLSGLKELQTLKLSHNFIDKMSSETFRHNPKLTLLHLDNNRLSSLPVFEGLARLEELTCSFNKLLGLPRGFAEALLMLKCLQVTNNLIRQWDPEVFRNTTSVLLSNNPVCSTEERAAPVRSTYIDCRKQQCSSV